MRKLVTGICLLVILSVAVLIPASIYAQSGTTKTPHTQGPVQQLNKYFSTQTTMYSDGTILSRSIINGPPVPPQGYELERATVSLPKPNPVMAINTLTVPAFRWVFGCSAVSGAMIAGYYDRNGFPNMYTGPTNDGVMPLVEDPSWGTWTDSALDTYPNNPLIASFNGLDGRSTRGSIDDYWISYGSSAPDPYVTGAWTQHAWEDVIGDYMKTSQSAHDNVDGATSFYAFNSASPLTCSDMESYGMKDLDGTYGRKLFYEARGYTVTDCYTQMTDNTYTGGFSFARYKAEIDAGHPVFLNLEGHSIVGVGYDDSSNTVYLHNTWNNDVHTMTWGGSYAGMALWGASIVNLQAPAPGVPDISVFPDSHDFGSVTISNTSTQTFTVSNTGTGDLMIGSVSIDGTDVSQFFFNGDNCSGKTISPSSSCTVQITFSPTSVGLKSATLSIPSNDPASPTVQVGLSGKSVAVPVPNIVVAPASLSFGSILVGEASPSQMVTIRNDGTASLDINGIDKTGGSADMFAVAGTGGTNPCGSLAPSISVGTSCNIWVTFAPSDAGPQSVTLQINSNDPDPAPQVALSGTGVIPDIEVFPVALTFGDILVDETSVAQMVTITNTGGVALNITSHIAGTSAAMFTVTPGGCADELGPGAVCTLAVTFTPFEYGAQSAILEILSTYPVSPTVQVALSGSGVYEATPSLIEGTYGAEITYGGAPSGFGTRKGEVYIGGLKQKVDSWSNTSIEIIVNKYKGLGTDTPYDVSIQPKEPKGTAPIDLPGAFTLRKPQVNPTNTQSGSVNDEITINGMWFGTKKGKVYVNQQKCKVLSWTMNPATGVSTLTFVVHKKIGAGTHSLEVENKIGRSLPFDFEVK